MLQTTTQETIQPRFYCARFRMRSSSDFCTDYQKKMARVDMGTHPCKGCDRYEGKEEPKPVSIRLRQGGRWKDNDVLFNKPVVKPAPRPPVPLQAHKPNFTYCAAGDHWVDRRNIWIKKTCIECHVRKRKEQGK